MSDPTPRRPLVAPPTRRRRDTLALRCFGWALVTGGVSGGFLIAVGNLWTGEVDEVLDPLVWVGFFAGTVLAIPVGLVATAIVLGPLRRALASSDPARAVRRLALGVVAAADAVVLTGALLQASTLERESWVTLGLCLLSTNVTGGCVLLVAARSLVRYGDRRAQL